MKLTVLSCLVSVATALCSCNSAVQSTGNTPHNITNDYKSKAKIIETFINIDYKMAYKIALEQAGDDQDICLDVMSIHSGHSTPWMLYLSSTDCSVCIVAILDFMMSFCHLSTDFETPVIVLKDGDKEIFDFYREKLLSHITDKDVIEKLQGFHVFNVLSDNSKNLNDGIYLIYRDQVINYMNWRLMH